MKTEEYVREIVKILKIMEDDVAEMRKNGAPEDVLDTILMELVTIKHLVVAIKGLDEARALK